MPNKRIIIRTSEYIPNPEAYLSFEALQELRVQVEYMNKMQKVVEAADKLADTYYLECVENDIPTPKLLAEYFQLRGEK